jgi:ubiquinol-cytochrome c reductase cytochrome c subunit
VVHPERGDVARGRRLFADSCSGCHQIAGKGGVDPEIVAPALEDATPVQVAEAIRVGPYLMPRFDARRLDAHDVDSIARYVTQVARHPENRGGWGIGNVGPIPEGLVAWLLAGGVLLLVARVIGVRTR